MSLKRPRNADTDDDQPPSKKLKLDSTDNEQKTEVDEDTLDECAYWAEIDAIIAKSNARKKRDEALKKKALRALNKRFGIEQIKAKPHKPKPPHDFDERRKRAEANQMTPQNLKAPHFYNISFHLQITRQMAGTNNDPEEGDFVTSWGAELRAKTKDRYFGVVNGHQQREANLSMDYARVFSGVDLIEQGYCVVATADVDVMQMSRLTRTHGLKAMHFWGMACSRDKDLEAKLEDLFKNIRHLDIESPGVFEAEHMNQGGPHSDIVLISKVRVHDSFKGNRYGRILVQRIMDTLAPGSARVVLKPHPAQYEANHEERNSIATDQRLSPYYDGIFKDQAEFERDRAKLIEIWESMGFKPICKKRVYWGRSQAESHPKVLEPFVT